MAQKPTIILVPGAWHTAETWDKVIALLAAQDYNCIAVTLPSTLSSPTTTYLEDLTAVRNAITAEIAEGRDVVLVVHSYGGSIGGSASELQLFYTVHIMFDLLRIDLGCMNSVWHSVILSSFQDLLSQRTFKARNKS